MYFGRGKNSNGTAGINDSVVSKDKVWSSAKTQEQIQLIPKGEKGDKGDSGTASVAIDDTKTNASQTWSSQKIQDGLNAVTPTDGSITAEKLADNLTIPLRNFMINTSYINNTITGWNGIFSTLSAQNGVLKSTVNSGAGDQLGMRQVTQKVGKTGNKIFLSFRTKINTITNLSTLNLIAFGVTVNLKDSIVAGEWLYFSRIITLAPNQNGVNLEFMLNPRFSSTVTEQVSLDLERVIAVDLTESFGANREQETTFENTLQTYYGGWFPNKVDLIPYYTNLYRNNRLFSARNIANTVGGFSSVGQSFIGDGTKAYIEAQGGGLVSRIPKNIYYFTCKVRVLEEGCSAIYAGFRSSRNIWTNPTEISRTTRYMGKIDNPVAGQEYTISVIVPNIHDDFWGLDLRVFALYPDATSQNGKTLTVSKGVIINLTETFGEGNEFLFNRKAFDYILSNNFADRFFTGISSFSVSAQDILKMMNMDSTKMYNGAYLKVNEMGSIEGSSAVNPEWDKWALTQYAYGHPDRYRARQYNEFKGTVETNAMFSVIAKESRWSPSVGGNHMFGGHVFEAWNNIMSYRLTMIMGKNAEDEACIQVFSPDNAYNRPVGDLTPEQQANRITQTEEDFFSPNAYFGKVRIGGDEPNQGFVFQKHKMTGFGNIEFNSRNYSVVLKSPNGSKYRLQVNDDGTLITVKVN